MYTSIQGLFFSETNTGTTCPGTNETSDPSLRNLTPLEYIHVAQGSAVQRYSTVLALQLANVIRPHLACPKVAIFLSAPETVSLNGADLCHTYRLTIRRFWKFYPKYFQHCWNEEVPETTQKGILLLLFQHSF